MDVISLRDMGNSEKKLNDNGVIEYGHNITKQHASLSWLDLRVFYIRVSKCVIDDDSTPEYLLLIHVPLNRDTLLQVNRVRTSIYADGISTLLKRDRLDKKSKQVTFVSTDSIGMTGSVKFEVFDKDQLVLLGTLDLSHSNGESEYQGWSWNMNCESNISTGTRFFQGSRNHSASPAIEVYVAGCFSGSSIVLTKALQLMRKRKQIQKVMLECIPEYEATRSQNDDSSTFTIQTKRYPACKEQGEGNWSPYLGMESYMEGEDGEVSWFNAGVRVGLGIGFSICVGLGIGVGLLATTYQGTTKYLCRRRLL